MLCPACGQRVIDGDEFCEECRYPLRDWEQQIPRSTLERSITRDRIRFLSPKTPLTVSPSTPVGDVIHLLVDRGIGCVIVADGKRIEGVFSERDALLRLNTQAGELLGRPVSEFMTHPVETLDIDDRIVLALQKMDLGGYRHLPVMEDDQLCGVISIRDILRYMTDTILTAG